MSASELLGGCAAGLTQDALLHPVDTRARLNAGGAADAGGTASALLSEAPRS